MRGLSRAYYEHPGQESGVEHRAHEEEELCERIAWILECGVRGARITSTMDKNPVLTTGCKIIFRQWVDVAALRAASEGSPAKMRRRMKDECIESRRDGGG